MAMRGLLGLLTLCTIFGASGCAGKADHPDRLPVAVSIPPMADVVERLAGEWVAVEVLVPPGADPDTYEPTLHQMKSLSRAALLIKVGHPALALERVWLGRLAAEEPRLLVVQGEGAGHADDPHVWTSPRWMRGLAERTALALARILPEHAALIRAREAALLAAIDSVDVEIRDTLAPARGRTFYVFHPAWQYFAEDYGLIQVSIEEHKKEPSADRLAQVIKEARSAGVKVIYSQPQFSRRSADLVAGEIGARVENLDPLVADWMTNLKDVALRLREALAP